MIFFEIIIITTTIISSRRLNAVTKISIWSISTAVLCIIHWDLNSEPSGHSARSVRTRQQSQTQRCFLLVKFSSQTSLTFKSWILSFHLVNIMTASASSITRLLQLKGKKEPCFRIDIEILLVIKHCNSFKLHFVCMARDYEPQGRFSPLSGAPPFRRARRDPIAFIFCH